MKLSSLVVAILLAGSNLSASLMPTLAQEVTVKCVKTAQGFSDCKELNTFKIPEGTPISVTLKDRISSKTARVYDLIYFTVDKPVEVNGIEVIKKGAIARATVKEISKARMLGRRGKLGFEFLDVSIADGSLAGIKSNYVGKGGGISGGMVAGVVLLSPLFLLLGGSEAKYEAGTQYNVYLAQDIYLDQSKFEKSKVNLN
ncbi:MAG TPA: hypothetical protein V6D19_02705 [Stenomitos sp.]